jgi:hypothetical protein
MRSTPWLAFASGSTLGATGSEGGRIARDEEHVAGARVTLEALDSEPETFAVTCGVYGLFVHTIYFASIEDVERRWPALKRELDGLTRPHLEHGAVRTFVERW